MLSLTKERVLRIIRHVLLIFIVYLLQSAIFSRFRIWGVSPLILPFTVVGIGLYEDGLRGGLCGIVAGLLCDVSLSDSGYLFTVFLTVVGLLTAFFAEFVLARGFPTYLAISLITTVIAAFLQMSWLLLFGGADFTDLLHVAAFQSLYSAFFIVPIYYPVRLVTRKTRN